MVYCGRPSKGCQRCRSRRIKCDTVRPSCGQCKRAHQNCTGYPDPVADIFRDLTATTIERHAQQNQGPNQKQKQCRGTIRVKTSPGNDTRAQHEQRDMPKLDKIGPLLINVFSARDSITNAAVYSLLTNGLVGSHFQFLPGYYGTATTNESLQTSLEAVALSRLATETGQPVLGQWADTKYGLALIETAKGLQSSESAKSANIVVSVLLLAFFEANSGDVEASTQAWTKHILGAYTILTTRNRALLSTDIGKRLFLLLLSCLTLHSLQQKIPLPEDLNQHFESIDKEGPVSSPRLRFQVVIEDFINLQVDLQREICNDASMVIIRAQSMDRKAQLLIDDMRQHPDFQFEVKPARGQRCGRQNDSCNHEYPSLAAMLLWNSVRVLRLLLNEMIWKYSAQIQLSGSRRLGDLSEREVSTGIITGICQEICASVPKDTPREEKESSYIAMVHFLIWPLFKVATTPHARPSQRQEALAMLAEMGRKYKVKRAIRAMEQAKKGDLSDRWMHVSHMF